MDVGFDICAITHADRINDLRPRLERFVTLGRHGTMGWMEETLERRGHPRALWPEARAIIMLGLSYAPDTDPMGTLDKATPERFLSMRAIATITMLSRAA